MPKISYLVSSYKSEDYIETLFWDLGRQTLQDYEIIVTDCSPPDSKVKSIIRRYARRDNRIRFINVREREPYGKSWIRCWENANSPFVSNANCDDFHDRHFGEVVVDHLCKAPEDVAFAYTGMLIQNEKNELIGGCEKPPFDRVQFSRACYAGPQVTWRRSLLEEIHDIDRYGLLCEMAEQYPSGFDYALWMLFMSMGYEGSSIRGAFTIYTKREQSIENQNKWENNWDTFHAMARFFPENVDIIPPEFLDGSNPPRKEWAQSMKEKGQWKK